MKTLLEIYEQESAGAGVGQGDKGTGHNYIQEYYIKVFEAYRNTTNGVLEIGVAGGHSIRMWRKYFENAKIIGMDIGGNPNCEGCEFIQADATKPESFNNIDNLDIVVDDGSHIPEHQIETFNLLFPKLNVGGIYVIEDIRGPELDEGIFKDLHPDMRVIDLRAEGRANDNIIIEIVKK